MIAPRSAIRWFDELDSTNAEARRLAEAGETGPSWIAARRQTAGRGRRGRAWETGEGNLAATLLVALDKPPAEAAQMSFVAALAVGDLARRYASGGVAYKWPNDVLLSGRKLAGVLIESGRRQDGLLWWAVGVGVNLRSAPEGTEFPATSLAAAGGAVPTPAEALGVLADAMDVRMAAWTSEGFEAVRRDWLKDALGLGGPCAARLPRETVEGVAEGLDPDGALVLRLADGEVRRITAGDVFFGGT